MNLGPVCRFLGRLLILLSVAEALPILVCWIYNERAEAGAFLFTSGITLLAGVLIGRLGGDREGLYRREGILIVVGGWVLASLFGALPYLLTGTLVSPIDALFESASGFTTTGASVLTEIEGAGYGILFWRSFTQWLGGMGIIVLFVALLPEIVPGARFLFKMEVPGPTAETLHPRVRDTAIVLWRIYLMLTGIQTALLMLVGMNLYDALTHTFSTLSTGGFSPRNESLAAFGPGPQIVVILFMLLSGVNFSLFYLFWHGSRRVLLRDPELRLYLALVGLGSFILVIDQTRGATTDLGRVVLDVVFQVVSIITTTGFATADFALWPTLSGALLVVLMFVGGCAGSTSGSMKVARMLMGIKFALREVRLVFAPNMVRGIKIGESVVPEPVVRSVAGFFILFLSIWGVGTLLLTLGGHDLVTAATACIATLGNVGPGLAGVGPTENFAQFAAGHKLLMVLLMWLGRLEVYAIAAVATARFWRH